ncbi:MAG: C39 family peptidase, partial [candidate division Zixibacteria bacterium]
IETADDWQKCNLVNGAVDTEKQSVIFDGTAGGGSLKSFPVEPGFKFTTLLFSWNTEKLPASSLLNFEVEVSAEGDLWHRFQYLTYGIIDTMEISDIIESPGRIDGIGFVDTDILKLEKPMRFARVLVGATGMGESERISLRRMSLCFAADDVSWREYRRSGDEYSDVEIGKVKLAVPYYTQRGMPEELSGNCCSPTSVTMVLNYHDKNVELIPFCHEVFDPYNDMYGNWPYNVQAAYLMGLEKTWVEIHSGFDEIYEEISEGKPVVISIAYGYDELPNSPIHEAEVGHLITVIGFDGPDIVICNDPAGHNAGDGIIRYPRKELEAVWIGHGGVAYHLWPL